MILVGRDLSPFVRRVAVALSVLGLKHERQHLSTIDDIDRIRAINPLGRVPALVIENNEAIVDSAAILDHLDEIAGPEKALTPTKGAARREVLRLMAIATGAMDKAVAALYEVNKRPAEKVHAPWREYLEGQVAGGLSALNEAAKGREFLVGHRLSSADIAAAVLWDFLQKPCPALRDATRYPNLAALAERLLKLPAFQQTSIQKYL